SCPMSNLYLGGMMDYESLQFEYSNLPKQGINVFHEKVFGVDRGARTLQTSGGNIKYDYLVLAVGIDYMWETIEGMWEARHHVPVAFKPGAEHLMLRRQLEDFEGGTMVLAIPKGPIRCPPGPYERAAMLAHHIKSNKIKGKLLILDANDKPMSKGPGFLGAYKDLYGGIVEYSPDHVVEKVDHKNKVIHHSFGKTKYDMANIIPQMKASQLVHTAGVSDGRWVEVNPKTLQTKKDDRVFVVGDVIGGQPFPKSGFTAFTLGKMLATQIANIMQGKKPTAPGISNTCYSTVDGMAKPFGTAIDVTHTFSWNEKDFKWEREAKANLERTGQIAAASREWARGIWFEMFGEHS
ncbi:MAG: NAD(P)/FAD-dependent oxidoreductase, partial [Deltaproteobacteria bacterium]|nr:NAD(P)/FAD-dependent oxidoreductase [Deltaproteobacteria bacterium]